MGLALRWSARARRFRALERRCEGRLAALAPPSTSDVAELCDHVGRRRGRPIVLMAIPSRGTRPCGMWLALPDVDLLAYEASTNRMHQEHIIAHELAHVICGHSSLGSSAAVDTVALFPDLDPALVRSMLGRGHYADAQEQEAEVMASLLLSRLDRHLPGGPSRGAATLMIRLERALLPRYRRRRFRDA